MARSAYAIKPQKVLLVEGNDDLHVIGNLCQANGVPTRPHFEIEDGKGYSSLRDALPRRLEAANEMCIGVVVDADTNLSLRWAALRDLLNRLEYPNVPTEPQPEGIILPGVIRAGKVNLPEVGVWIMPDNTLPGALEEFIRHLVPPENSLLWDHAEACVANLPIKPEPLTENWNAKARIHSYLSWQEEPGKPMGVAITARYLAGEVEAARPFLNWLCRLFDLPNAPAR